MAARAGRQVKFYWGGNSPADEIQGVREKSIASNGEPIDVTADDSDGWREVLTIAAENQVSVGISGVTKDRRFITDWYAGIRTQAVQFVYPGGDTLTGTFFISSLTETEPYNEASTFEAQLISTGVVTYTPVP
jgi:predicted secreted protein